jgi:tetratricopeptide (TPR) repeat protein
VQIALGKLDAARSSAQLALKTDPNDASMRLVIGRVALAEGNADAALTESKAALAVLPNLASAKLLMADAYAKQREIDLAIESYQAAFGLDRSDPGPLVRASDACRTQGRSTTARAFAERATREFPEWSPAWLALGDALTAQKELPAARHAYEQAVAKARGPSDAAVARARLGKVE